jgi:hypothetical protein
MVSRASALLPAPERDKDIDQSSVASRDDTNTQQEKNEFRFHESTSFC